MSGSLNLVPGFYPAWIDEIGNEVNNSASQPVSRPQNDLAPGKEIRRSSINIVQGWKKLSIWHKDAFRHKKMKLIESHEETDLKTILQGILGFVPMLPQTEKSQILCEMTKTTIEKASKLQIK